MQLDDLIEKAVAGLGYECVDFETSPRARLLRVFIDKTDAEKGVTIDDCVAVSNHLSRLFAVENVDYDRLEVSSPGMDRPLKKLADFARFAGQEAQIKLRVPVGNQRNFAGVIVGVRECDEADEGEGVVAFRVGEVEHVFALDAIDKARLVPKF
ncbi:MAG: ribosome maturation factor RimP [Rhodocyclaceae bacterium]|nr:ribosome maturation factor RimP [Rhodocyclaceae bacterium]